MLRTFRSKFQIAREHALEELPEAFDNIFQAVNKFFAVASKGNQRHKDTDNSSNQKRNPTSSKKADSKPGCEQSSNDRKRVFQIKAVFNHIFNADNQHRKATCHKGNARCNGAKRNS